MTRRWASGWVRVGVSAFGGWEGKMPEATLKVTVDKFTFDIPPTLFYSEAGIWVTAALNTPHPMKGQNARGGCDHGKDPVCLRS